MENEDLKRALFGQKALPKEPYILDRSFLEKYAVCPYQAWACKEHNIDEPATLKELGKVIHKLVEESIKQSEGDAVIAAEYFVEELPKIRPDLQPDALIAARWIGDKLANSPLHKMIGCEYQIDYELVKVKYKDRPIKLTACIDLLMAGQGNLIIYDWKTGYKKRTNTEAYSAFQTQFIAYILWQMFPGIETIHFFYIETRYGTTAYARLDRTKESPRLPHLTTELAIQGRIMEAVKLWLTDNQEAWPEPKKCAWCDAIRVCPYADTMTREISDSPFAVVDHLCVLEELVTKYKKALADHLRKFGPVKGTKTVFEWRKRKQKFTPKIYKAETEKEEEEEVE